MQTDEAPVTKKEDIDTSPSPEHGNKSDSKKSDTDDPKPRIVLTFRSEKSGARTSNMKIVSTEEKHEEISPRRSSRTRGMKKESDDDTSNISHLESEDDSHDGTQKRSTRRISKEYSDVIANAIARKEKSYETSTPTQRLSRRIKPTAKILANEELRMGLESQNNARLGISSDKVEGGVRTRRSAQTRNVETKPIVGKKASKRKIQEDAAADSSDRESDSSNKKLMHLGNLGLKVKDEESSEAENRKTGSSTYEAPDEEDDDDDEDYDDDDDDEEIDDDTEVISKLLEADEASASDEEFCPEITVKKKRSKRNSSIAPLRRSSRKANSGLYYYDEFERDDSGDSDYAPKRKNSRSLDDDEVVREGGSEGETEEKVAPEAASAEADEEVPEAACPADSSTIVATCLCEDSSNIYAAPSELSEPVFCQAIELVDGVRVGCSHAAAREADGSLQPLRRAGPRAPYFLACRQHAAQLAKHMCCPTCGLFCTQGIFYQCSKNHLYHMECGIPGGDKQKAGCPHCGVHSYRWLPVNKEFSRVRVDMHCSNKRVFLPDQREQCTPAFLGFSSVDPSQVDQGPSIPDDLLPALPSDIKTLFDAAAGEEMSDHSVQVLYEAIMAGEPAEQLIPKILRGDHINAALAELEGGTCVHAAAARGRLGALCLLQYAGANIDAVDNASRTPLMRAILSLLDKEPEEILPETMDEEACEKQRDKAIEDDVGEIGVKETSDIKNNEETKETEDNTEKNVTKEKDKGATTERDNITEKQENKVIDDKEDEIDTKEEEHLDDISKTSDEDLIKVIKYLVAVGCDIDKQGPEGMSALHLAAQHGSAAVCAALLQGGAHVDPRDQGGWTPLVRAAENKHKDVLKLLLEHGADPAASDNEGNLAVHWCALSGDARCLSLLLRAAPHALDAPNAHTDTPLHIAAREGHYPCVVILLAHGAKTELENSAGELPAEVCEGRCRDAIDLHMQMTLALRDKIPRHRILSSDISNGREVFPVPCVNEVDDAPLPADFVYVSQHVTHAHVPLDDSVDTMQGCACADAECGGECACCVLGVRRWYARGRLPRHFPHHDPPMLFECNQTCACNLKRCSNRVVSRVEAGGSLGVRVAVYRTARCGWGLRAQQRVERGALVALYRGELLAHEHADSRANDQYMFALDLKPDLLEECSERTQLCVDAARFGSAARFMNHSCRPSVAPVRVFTRSRDLRAPNVALFALRDLPAGSALTFDYGDKFWSVKSKWIKCECESPDCRYPTKTVDEMET